MKKRTTIASCEGNARRRDDCGNSGRNVEEKEDKTVFAKRLRRMRDEER